MSQPYLRRRALDNSHWYMGHLASALATTADSGGILAISDITLRGDTAPPAYCLAHEEEALFILDGRFEGWAGGTRLSGEPGDLLYLPKGQPHAWSAQPGADGATARALAIAVPGTLANLYARCSEPAQSLTLPDPDPQKLQEVAAQMRAGAEEFGITWMPSGYTPAALSDPAPPLPCLPLLGEQFRPLAVAAQTNGAFTAMEWLSPAQSGLPKHLHQDADEVFYILEGAVAITAGDDFSVVATPGDFVFLPKGLAHTHRATGGQPSRAFQLLTPGGIEAGLAEVAALAPEETTPQRLAECAARANLILFPD